MLHLGHKRAQPPPKKLMIAILRDVCEICNKMCNERLFAHVYACPSNIVYKMYKYHSIGKIGTKIRILL